MFERLGAESKTDTTNNTEVGSVSYDHSLCKASVNVWNVDFSQPTGVFSRLDRALKGEIKLTSVKTPGIIEVDDDSDGDGSVLQYAGVLKRSLPSQKQEPGRKAAPTTLRRLGGKFKLPPSDTPTSSSNGIVPAKRSVLQRLGKIPATQQAKGASPTPADTQDNRVTTSTKPRGQERLTIASPKVSSSTGAGGAGEPIGAQMDVRAVSVFNRLGSKKP